MIIKITFPNLLHGSDFFVFSSCIINEFENFKSFPVKNDNKHDIVKIITLNILRNKWHHRKALLMSFCHSVSGTYS